MKRRFAIFTFILILLLSILPIKTNADFEFKSFGISLCPAFSTDGMHKWFNTKFEVDWNINDRFDLETSLIFLKVNTLYDKERLFKEVWLFSGLLTSLKYDLSQNFSFGSGFGVHLTNFNHYNLDETYIKLRLGFNLSLEYKIRLGKYFRGIPILRKLNKIEVMYFFIPINLLDTTFNSYYNSHIFALSINFKMFKENNNEK